MIDTPRLSPTFPSVTFWAPSSKLLSIMTPRMPFSPLRSCSATSAMTLGWLRWSLDELACEASTITAGRKGCSFVEAFSTPATADRTEALS